MKKTALLTVAFVLVLSGCTSGKSGSGSSWHSPGTATAAFTVTPAENANDVPVSAEIALKDNAGTLTDVKLTGADGKTVDGEFRTDKSSWVPGDPLKYSTAYTASVTAKDKAGKTGTSTTKFTTMARPGNRMEAHLYMGDNATYGQAMPIVVEFKNGGVSSKANRAAVERRMFVTSDPPQTGAWHWDSNIQAEYRPKDYWQPGTKLTVRLALGGLPIGDGRYGAVDIDTKASIDTVRREIDVDNTSKQLTAKQDGQVVKTFPVSLGKPAKPSFSGNMVIMERLDKTVFDSSTYGTPVNAPDGYRTDIQWAERLTWDGQFIHAAPWSVKDQGKRNVSHGCVNVSLDNGAWIYNWTKVGDPVIVKGTEKQLPVGDGFTAWTQSWDQFIQGSALEGGVAPSVSPS
jgi:lipoprotein-anchoring transpeptidase ErfK/SrfK